LGSKAYDLMSGRQSLTWAYFLNKSKVKELFPTLKSDSLKGGIVYHDGGMNDARLNVTIALTAVKHGAACANHVSVQTLLHDENGNVKGALCKDMMTGDEFTIKAKGVISAAGPFTDGIRTMDDPAVRKIVSPAAGTHIMLPTYLMYVANFT
jgi:glycerol-3-phosphate dehydrogenase